MLRTRIKELSEPKKCLARGREIEDEMRSLPPKDARAVHMYAYSPLSYNARIELATQSVRAFLSGPGMTNQRAASKARVPKARIGRLPYSTNGPETGPPEPVRTVSKLA